MDTFGVANVCARDRLSPLDLVDLLSMLAITVISGSRFPLAFAYKAECLKLILEE